MPRAYNFSAGPAMLPESVMQSAQAEFLNWHDLGASVMEISHRSVDFEQLYQQMSANLRTLLNIPNNYQVLFLPGGARTQFAALPMNLLGKNPRAAYVDTGLWSSYAIAEAKNFGEVRVVASAKAEQYRVIPTSSQWQDFQDCAYLHYVDNETVQGVEFPSIPESSIPLVADMSSNILSRPFDVSRFGVVYACSQKNMGPAGMTLVIVRDDLLKQALPNLPSVNSYQMQLAQDSMLNTPATFVWYMANLVFAWVLNEGGVAKMQQRSLQKSKTLYELIDASDFYHNAVDPACRSRMNVIFSLTDESLNIQFLEEAKEHNLLYLKGHKTQGGMRASLYNAMPQAGVDALAGFMQEFARRCG